MVTQEHYRLAFETVVKLDSCLNRSTYSRGIPTLLLRNYNGIISDLDLVILSFVKGTLEIFDREKGDWIRL